MVLSKNVLRIEIIVISVMTVFVCTSNCIKVLFCFAMSSKTASRVFEVRKLCVSNIIGTASEFS